MLLFVCVIYITTSQRHQYNNNQHFWQFDVCSTCGETIRRWKVLFHVNKYLTQMKKKKILFPLGANFLQSCSQHIFSVLEESQRVTEWVKKDSLKKVKINWSTFLFKRNLSKRGDSRMCISMNLWRESSKRYIIIFARSKAKTSPQSPSPNLILSWRIGFGDGDWELVFFIFPIETLF